MAIHYNMFRRSFMESQIGRPLKYRGRVNNHTMHRTRRVEYQNRTRSMEYSNRTRSVEYPSNEILNERVQTRPIKPPKHTNWENQCLTNPKKRIKYSTEVPYYNPFYQQSPQPQYEADLIPDLFVRNYHSQMRIISSVTFEAPDVLLNFFPFTLLAGRILMCRYLTKFKDFFYRVNAPPINLHQLYLIACSMSEKLYMECINRQYSPEQNRILNLFAVEMDFDLDIDSSELYAEWVFVK